METLCDISNVRVCSLNYLIILKLSRILFSIVVVEEFSFAVHEGKLFTEAIEGAYCIVSYQTAPISDCITPRRYGFHIYMHGI